MSEAMRSVLLFEADHPEGMVYATDAINTIDWNGQSYIGMGLVLDVTGMEQSSKVEVPEVSFTVTIGDSDFITGLSLSVKNRQITVRQAEVNEFYQVLGTPEVIDILDMDSQELDTAQGSITINCFGGLYELNTAPDVYYTPEEQRAIYAGDTGLDAIPSLVSRVASWSET